MAECPIYRAENLVNRILCGELGEAHMGSEISLYGWVRKIRDHGELIFVDLADYSGFSQLVFSPKEPRSFAVAESLHIEYVIWAKGTLRERPEGTDNPKLKTGNFELEVSEAQVIGSAQTPPFLISDEIEAKEELRLRYRYLDLRRPKMQKILRGRHEILKAARGFLDSKRFCEIETPALGKTTPEGARDFLVPSRIHRGSFYALPQSPQLYKQILMCAGFDRYYQIARCYRDEDLRANRQPEFTQIDIEMSFANEVTIRSITEGLIATIWKEVKGVELSLPFPTLSYDDAMERYGSDAPDLRFGLLCSGVEDLFADSDFKVFRQCLDSGGVIRGFCFADSKNYSRRELEELNDVVTPHGAKGLCWFKVEEGGAIKSPVSKFISKAQGEALIERFSAEENDIVVLIADEASVVYSSLGALRTHLAERLGLIDESLFAFSWVENFPLFDYDKRSGRYVSMHHPFTSPVLDFSDPTSVSIPEGDPSEFRARAYDLVLNGQEIAGGSVRISSPDLQMKVFELIGLAEEEARAKFSFLMDALNYGAPPHCGIAVGLDRLVMILEGVDSIRDVIAFPKTQRGQDLMLSAPSGVSHEQLLELGIRKSS